MVALTECSELSFFLLLSQGLFGSVEAESAVFHSRFWISSGKLVLP